MAPDPLDGPEHKRGKHAEAQPPFDAVIFDLDGTLIDTEMVTCEWIAGLLRPHGLAWTPELHRHIAGTMHFFPGRCLELLGVPPERAERLAATLPPRLTSPDYIAFLAERMRIKPGAEALVHRLWSRRVPMALCTSRAVDSLAALEAARPDLASLLAPFGVRVVGSVDPRTGRRLPSKPDPDVYTACMELLGTAPSRCLAFEDAPSGVRAAKAAGAFAVTVPEPWAAGDADCEAAFALADQRVASLADVGSLDELLGPAAPLLLGCGNATVDLTCKVTREDLAQFGLAPGTEASGLDEAAKAAIVDFATARSSGDSAAAPGGAALNTVRVAAWSAGRALRAAFVGAVGRDAHAAVLRKAMADVGVVPCLKEVADLRTGVCASLVEAETKDRTLSTVRGAAGALDAAFVETPGVAALAEEAALLYVTGFVLTSEPRVGAVMALASKVCQHGGLLAVNLSSAGILQKAREPLLQLLPRCHFAFGNAAELAALGALLGWPAGVAVGEAAVLLARLLGPSGLAVATSGAAPTVVGTADGSVREFAVPEVPLAEIKDTNGAGDAFAGGFLAAALSRSAPLEACVAEGHRCASFVLRRHGCDLRD